MSRVRRLLLSDRIFFVTIHQHRAIVPLSDPEYAEVVAAIEQSRRKLAFSFLPG